MPATKGRPSPSGNPPWTEEETVLALHVLLSAWPRVPDKGSAEVRALSDLLRSLPIHCEAGRSETFRNPDGVAMTLQNLASLHPERANRPSRHTSRVDRDVWSRFAGRLEELRATADSITGGAAFLVGARPPSQGPLGTIFEGTILEHVHHVRERDPRFRARVLARVRDRLGFVACEACGFAVAPDAMAAGVDLLSAFEVHHVVPLSLSGVIQTRLQDLVLLCATCHRMIHAFQRGMNRHALLETFRAWRVLLALPNPNPALTSPAAS